MRSRLRGLIPDDLQELRGKIEDELLAAVTVDKRPLVSPDARGVMSRRYVVYRYAGFGDGCGWIWMAAMWAFFVLVIIGPMSDDWVFALGAPTVMMLPFALMQAWHLCRTVHEIYVASDGTIEFVSKWRRQAVLARDIRHIQGIRSADYNGRVQWQVKIIYGTRRVVKIDYFDEARDFLHDVTALNPLIDVTGEWPSLGYPERY